MDSGFGPLIVYKLAIPGTDIVIPITQTVTVTWLIMAVLIIGSILVTKNFERIPRGIQNVVEMLVETIVGLTKSTMGEKNIAFAPYIGTVLIFLAVANTVGIIGIRPPTADLNTTAAFAIITFLMIEIGSLKTKHLGGYLKSFTQPIFLMTPINMLSEFATPLSLAFRLFGNIVGGLIIGELFYNMLASFSSFILGSSTIPILQLALPIPMHLYFDMFSGILQSFIFVMLTMVNVSMAME